MNEKSKSAIEKLSQTDPALGIVEGIRKFVCGVITLR